MTPQVLPAVLGNMLYYVDPNTRSSTILGIVVASGIGRQLSDRNRVTNWDEAAIVIMIFVTFAISDYLSKLFRPHVIAAEDQPNRTVVL